MSSMLIPRYRDARGVYFYSWNIGGIWSISGLSIERDIMFLPYKRLISTLKPKIHQNLFKNSVRTSEKTINFYYIDKSVNVVWGNNCRLFWESYEPHKAIICIFISVFIYIYIYICGIFNDAVSSSQKGPWLMCWLMNNELGRMWKEVVVD
jgi:hypothetical protein